MSPVRAFLFLLALAQPLAAEDWEVLVLGNPSRSAPAAFADAHAAAEAFKRLSIGQVTLRREVGADALAGALDGLVGVPRVVIYFAGPIGSGSSGPMLMGQGGGDARGAIGPLLVRLAAGGTTEAVLLIEDCAGGPGVPGRLLAPEVPTGMTVFMAASAGAAEACLATDRLTDRLSKAGGGALQDIFAGLWTGATSLAPVETGPAPAPSPAAASAALVDVVDGDVIRIAPVTISASAPTEVLSGTPVEVPAAAEGPAATPTAAPAVFRPLRDEDILALPVAAGMPRPSIIVGIIRAEEPDLPEIAFDDVPAREALRSDDPALFQTMVEAGAFDPPPESLVLALQTELQRLGCYTSTVDGQWGNGSRRAVDRFAETAGLTPAAREPEPSLYRQILIAGPLECPAPVVEAAPVRTAPRATDPAPTATRTAPAPAPNPEPAPPLGGPSNLALGGVLR